MSINRPYLSPADLPAVLPVFPLSGALLLPRGQLPLNIFEPRYLALIDDALRTDRLIGMIQPAYGESEGLSPPLQSIGCAGRITQIAETGDGRYMLTLTGVARFQISEELATTTPYRQCNVSFEGFMGDFTPRLGEDSVDRDNVLKTLRAFANVNRLSVDWDGVNEAPNEALVNALSMMCPFGPREKQALLEAPDLRARADVLVAITEFELARGGSAPSGMQ